ncbi:MAG: type II toxin-antitoxin system VapC family toxin [Gammaproteobacteria bacterium]|nr:type II toxin-antitoxin system VapC family toxin [Rhodocyclaceae bacterium]MBU3909555.1 type II toxin-antitoxin system VapC family toxin [Gammaproteobacteria bacterium]MBU3990838.1 type II toxin-antitoxin system VapC family toxin [Gammaproteobacteria bacterium]MBU4003218.1 type II toxin-antitoxin system VapC family toxin [Gammaproteobacteria bacterium]MBU4022267.1 type II toxin-antitoxin system VapC family toxin [Gammaproteobacteria bacterium]
MPFVVDNSVVAGWHFGGQATPYTEAALDRLVDDIAHAPALWPLEFSNVLRKALTGKKIDAARAQEILRFQAELSVVVHGGTVDPAENLALALRHNLSSYDAAYLDLALRLQLPIATQDAALRDAALASGVGVWKESA